MIKNNNIYLIDLGLSRCYFERTYQNGKTNKYVRNYNIFKYEL